MFQSSGQRAATRPDDFLRGVAMAIAGVLCVSMRPILIKLAYRELSDPVTILAIRMAFCLPFFAAIFLFRRNRRGAPIARTDWLMLIMLGVSGYYLSSLLDFIGLQYINPGVGRLITFTYPGMVIALSAIVLHTMPKRSELVSLAMTYCGLAIVLWGAAGGPSPDFMAGAAYVFAGAFFLQSISC